MVTISRTRTCKPDSLKGNGEAPVPEGLRFVRAMLQGVPQPVASLRVTIRPRLRVPGLD